MDIKIKVPYWAFPSIGDEFVDFKKMKSRFESKGDYKSARKVALKIIVMENIDMFSPTHNL